MLRTEDGFLEDHVDTLLNSLYTRVGEIENGRDLSAEDEMELAALDRIIVALESL
jgi:hypothetical protein